MKLSKRFAKRAFSLILALLMIAGIPVFSFAQEAVDEEARINEICNHFPGPAYNARYYGFYDGYDIVFIDDGVPAFTVITDEVIAGYTFTFSDSHGPDCFYAYKDGSFTTVKDAYSYGYFSRNDIAAIYEIFWGLDEVKKDYLEYLKVSSPDDSYIQSLGVENIVIEEEYGRFDGYLVLYIRPETVFGDQITLSLEIGGFTFEFPSTDDVKYFLAYRDGEFIPVKEAYDAHKLTEYSIEEIFEEHIDPCEEFAAYYNERYNMDKHPEDFRLIQYYGNYNGYDAFRIGLSVQDNGDLFDAPSTYVEVVAGYSFTCTGHSPWYGLVVCKDGEFRTLNDAYARLILTRADIESIYCKEYGITLNDSDEFEQVAADYIDYLKQLEPDNKIIDSLTTDDIFIESRYGDFYGDYSAYIMRYRGWSGVGKETTLEIEGYRFTVYSENKLDHFLIYKDGRFTRIDTAYESGMIPLDGIRLLQSSYNFDRLCYMNLINPLKDVNEFSWYSSAVGYVKFHGLMLGVGDGYFAPHTTMTRAMFVTTLWSMAGSPRIERQASDDLLWIADPFLDVDVDKWYSAAVRWAAYNNVVAGVSMEIFDPNADLNRMTLATMLYSYYRKVYPADREITEEEIAEILARFPDGDTVSPWARESVAWAVKNGLIDGIPMNDENYLSPRTTATRAQVATIIKNFTLKF